MKLNGQQNIILDEDITISQGVDEGKKLSEVLNTQTTRLNQLTSNVKWLYKYGGVGSGSGGGGGTSGSWTVQVSRTDTGDILRDGVTLNLGKSGWYGFKVQIFNGGTSTFKVTYNYTNSKGSQTKSEIVWSEQGFASTQSFLLDMNGQLNITILNQDTQEAIQYAVPFIVNAYVFSLQYVDAKTLSPITFDNNTIFMSVVKEHGLKVLFTSNVSVDITSSSYTYVDWKGRTHTVGMDEEASIKGNANKKIYLELVSEEDGGIISYLENNDNAGFKQFLLDIDLLLKGNTEPEDISQLSLKDNLIPSNTYLRVSVSGGTIYETEQQIYPESGQFNLGSISFKITPFDGPYDPNKTYDLLVYDSVKTNGTWADWGSPLNIGVNKLSDQTEQTIVVRISNSGEHRIKFNIVSSNGGVYNAIYYFYVKESTSSFTWFEDYKTIGRHAYYRSNNGVQNVQNISQSDLIEMNANSVKKSYRFNLTQQEELNGYDQFISIGLQYSEINDTSKPIASIDTDSNGRIFIYQNKVLIASNLDVDNPTGDEVEIYFPLIEELSETKTLNYHLLSIYKRYEIQDGDSYYKTISVYIDGVFEGVFKNMTAQHKDYTGVTFYPGNYMCNLFEYATFRHNTTIDNRYYNQSSQSESVPFLTDNDFTFYYYTYKEIEIDPSHPITDVEQSLYTYFKSFREDKDNFVHTNSSTIESIGAKSPIPVMVINSVDNTGKIGNIGPKYGQDNFKIWMSQSFEENSVIDDVTVTIQWKGVGDNQLRTITKQNETSAALFSITLQGSSTLGYRCKNFELMAPSASRNEYSCIYSPNFNENDSSTFLPESSFTLKADVVDSSHTNNNAMGSFVNSVTTPFGRAQQTGRQYSNYIKNCLTGKAFLLFLHTSYKSTSGVPSPDMDQFYFLGIYNLNLGRKSYYNLGYKDLRNLTTIEGGLKNGFNIYDIADSNNTLLNGVVVSEIQGNNAYFDFSQSDRTVLFNQFGDQDETYMFGDFVDGNGSNAVNAKEQIQNLVQRISLAGGWIFEKAGKLFSNTIEDNYGYDEGYSATDIEGIPTGQVPNYFYKATRSQSGTKPSYTFEPMTDKATETDFITLVEDDDALGTKRLLDYTSLCEYYTTCMAFGLVDSVQKNLNIKSWNAPYGSINQDNTNEILFYLAFYDMDTCLGVSNSGAHIDYFAFSDYWDSNVDGNTLKNTIVYRDYSPKANDSEEGRGSFFDIPSSYLFAIAKYGFFAKNELETNKPRDPLFYHPSNLWAIWRHKDKIENPSKPIEKQYGCLANADVFMNEHYVSHLDGVPYSAFNYNYRYKYFVKVNDGLSFDDTNFQKFYGRKVAYTKNWLEGRFHLLDAYFNLNSITDVMVEGSVYAPFADSSLTDSSNEDIYVLKDVFSTTSTGNQYVVDTNVLVESRPYAPLILKSSNASNRYIFPNDTNRYSIYIKTYSNQYLLYGGSSLWTYVNTINPFITSNKTLRVDSKYFTNLVGNSSDPCNTWTLKTPSLKSISLTGGNYSGSLVFDSSGSAVNFPNLTDITISGTNINLEVNRGFVETINAVNMKDSSSIKITNIDTLKEGQVNINGNMVSLTIPAWQQNIYLPTDYLGNNNSEFNCNSITISNDINKFSNNKLYIYNNDTLTNLSFSGFTEVYIEKCPNLSNITITGRGDILEKLTVIMPDVSTHTTFSVNNNENLGIVNLSSQTVLMSIKFNYCKMNTVILPPVPGMRLYPRAFYGCSELTYLRGSGDVNNHYYIDSTSAAPYTFANCKKFTMRQSSDVNAQLSPIYTHAGTTSLEGLFYIEDTTTRGSITLETASDFLKDHCTSASSVTNISYMFYNQNIDYSLSEMLADYNQSKCALSLGNFKWVTSATRTFMGNKISGYNRYMFAGLGESVNKISISNMVGEFSSRDRNNDERWIDGYHVLYATTDFLYEVLDKISVLSIYGYSYTNSYLCFIDNDGAVLNTEIKLGEEVFRKEVNNTYVYPSNLQNLSYIEVYPLQHINFTNMFWYSSEQHEGWIAAGVSGLTLNAFFYYGGSAYTNFSGIEYLLKYVKITSVARTLNGFTGGERIDMFNFLNWEGLSNATNLFYSQYASLGFSKTISYDNFKQAWGYMLSAQSLRGVGYLFENCIITVNNTPSPFKLNDNANLISDTIQNTYRLFTNCKLAHSADSTDYLPMEIRHSFLNCIPRLVNAQYMFYNTYWSNTIPFDFFHKRSEVIENVYVGGIVDGHRSHAVLYKYNYTKNMVDIRYCFRNVVFDSQLCFKTDAPYNEGSFKACRVVETSTGNVYDKYYLSESVDAQEFDVVQNTEVTDALESEALDASEYIAGMTLLGHTFTNFSVAFDNNKTGCFVTPDIYYGMSETDTNRSILYSLGVDTANVTGSSITDPDGGRMSGLVPKYLLKNVKNVAPTGILSNLNLLPWHIDDYEGSVESETVIYKCYCYIPSNFTTYPYLSDMFNFHLILPYTLNYSIYYVMHNDSIPSNTTTLSYGLPGVSSDNYKDSLIGYNAGWPNTALTDFGFRYNIMFEEKYTEIEDEWVYEESYPSSEEIPHYEQIPELPDPVTESSPLKVCIDDGNTVTYYDKIATHTKSVFSPIDGIDMNKFTYLKLDNLISVPLSYFLSGRLFKSGTLSPSQWSSKKYLVNKNAFVATIGYNISYKNGLSKNAILPLNNINDHFIHTNVTLDNVVQINKASVDGGYLGEYQNYGNINWVN